MELPISSKYYTANLDLQVIGKETYVLWTKEQFQNVAEAAEGIIITSPNGAEVCCFNSHSKYLV